MNGHMEERPTLDAKSLRDLLEYTGDALFIRNMLMAFLHNMPQLLLELQQVILQGHLEEVAKIAHKMSSTAGTYGLKKLAYLLLVVEDLSKGQKAEELLIQLSILEDVFQESSVSVHAFLEHQLP